MTIKISDEQRKAAVNLFTKLEHQLEGDVLAALDKTIECLLNSLTESQRKQLADGADVQCGGLFEINKKSEQP